MNISYWISRHLDMRRRPGSGSSAAVVIAVAGVALALIVMEFTLAIVVGFKDGIRAKLSGFDAQINVGAPYHPETASSDETLKVSPGLVGEIEALLPPSADIRMSLRRPAILKTDSDFHGVVFIAQEAVAGDRKADYAFERSNIVEGEWPDYENDSTTRNDIVISRAIASKLGLATGDKVFSTFFVDDAIKVRRSTVRAIYESNFGEYDRNVAYASMPFLRSVCRLDSNECGRLDIRGLSDDTSPAELASELQTALINAAADGRLANLHPVDNIMHTGALYFSWLKLLDTNVAVIFTLMLLVAAFTLVSSLFILILERVRTIGILMAMGATRRQVRRIFVFMALRLVGLGMIIGNVVAIALLLIQKSTGIIPLDPDMYYLASVPVEIRFWQFAALNAGVALASWLILVLPARLASATDPAKSMKYE